MFHIHFTLKVNIDNLESELPFYIILKIDIQDMEGKKDRKDFKQAQLVRGNYRIHSNVALCTLGTEEAGTVKQRWGTSNKEGKGPIPTTVALLVIDVLHSEPFLGVVSSFNQSVKVIWLSCTCLSVILVLLAQEAKSRVRYTFVVSWTVSFKKIRSDEIRCVQGGMAVAWGWCPGMTQRDGMGREEGGGFRMGNTCTPVADACWCMAKPIQYCKVKIIIINK